MNAATTNVRSAPIHRGNLPRLPTPRYAACMPKAYFVSDLHLFANRSEAARYREAMDAAAAGAAAFVLGGDIFDFRWSTLATIEQTVDAAIWWLEKLLADAPACQFHYLLGNHDYHRQFIDRLDHLARSTGNLAWHRYYLRLGNNVFLHGDVADRPASAARLSRRRSRWLHQKKRGSLRSRFYDAAIRARLHKPLPYVMHPRWLVARRILAYLEDVGQGPDSGVRHVFFGHTHCVVSNYPYGGLMFHNSGSAIKGLEFRILEALV